MRELIGANWIVLSPIILLSVAAIGIIIERAVFFRGIHRAKGDPTIQSLLGNLGTTPRRDFMLLLGDCSETPAVHLLKTALDFPGRGTGDLFRQTLETHRDRMFDRMERRLSLLPGIGNVATLLGLLGTVSGMITAFSRMTETGSSDPYVLAGGISRALVTTAAGLAVAIPSMFFHHLFESIIDTHGEEMEEVVSECLLKAGAANARKRESKTT